MSLVKSKQRVADHGEVFTPGWMVEAMLDLVKGETERIDSRFLEPACGNGNFLVQVVRVIPRTHSLKPQARVFWRSSNTRTTCRSGWTSSVAATRPKHWSNSRPASARPS